MLGNIHGKWRAGLLLSGLLVVLAVAGAFVFHLGTMPQASASAALWPATASPGSMVLVTGQGLPTQERVQVYFQTPDRGTVAAFATANGSFSVPLIVPSAYIPGTQYYVYVNSQAYSTRMLFTFAKPSLSLTDPSTQPVYGASTSFTGTGFKPDEQVNLDWSYGMGSPVHAGTVLASGDGSFVTTLTMPSFAHGTQGKLVATGSTSGLSANTTITEAAGLVYDPTSAAAGDVVNLQGGAFAANELVGVSFEGNPVARVNADPNGFISTSFTLSDSSLVGYEDNAIVVSGVISGAQAKGGFHRTPKITLSPNHGPPRTRMTVTGKHFKLRDEVRIYFVYHEEDSSSVVRILEAVVHASEDGTFSVTITSPKGAEDVNQVVVVDEKELASAVFHSEDTDHDPS